MDIEMLDEKKKVCETLTAEEQFKMPYPERATCLRDGVADATQALEQLVATISNIQDEFESNGPGSGLLATMLQFAGRDLFTLGAHLDTSEDQAKVFTVLGSCAEGAAMQQALDTLDKARAELIAEGAHEDELAFMEFDPESLAADRIAVEHNLTTSRAGSLLDKALGVHRCTRIWNVLMYGGMSAAVAQRIAEELEHVEDQAKLLEIQDRILAVCLRDGKCVRWSSGMTQKLHRIINKVDPNALKRDEKDTKEKRDVRMWPAAPSGSTIAATLPALEAEAVWSSVDNLAASWAKLESETRTLAERRADALVQMVTGIDKRPEGDCTPIGHQVCSPNVTLVADVAAGAARQRAFAAKGSSTRKRLDELLDAAHSAQLATVPLRTDELGTDLADFIERLGELVERLNEEITYKPSTALRRLVVERDGFCRFPGCQVPARKCDLDHVIPFDHNDPLRGGLSREGNLIALCRHHHRDKTHNETTYRLKPDGSVWVAFADGTTGSSEPAGHRGHGRTELGLTYETVPENYREQVLELASRASELAALCTGMAATRDPGFVVDMDAAPDPERRKTGQTKAERRAEATKKYRRRPHPPRRSRNRVPRPRSVLDTAFVWPDDGANSPVPTPKKEYPEEPPY